MGTPSDTAVKYLFAHSRNLCFFNVVEGDDRRSCEVALTDKRFKRTLGQIAHIKADSELGPRYDKGQTESERQGEGNLMLLCPNCHKVIDELEPDRFTVEALLLMKERHLRHSAEGWSPSEEWSTEVAHDMVQFFIERLQRGAGAGDSGNSLLLEDGGTLQLEGAVGPSDLTEMNSQYPGEQNMPEPTDSSEARWTMPIEHVGGEGPDLPDDAELFDSPLRPASERPNFPPTTDGAPVHRFEDGDQIRPEPGSQEDVDQALAAQAALPRRQIEYRASEDLTGAAVPLLDSSDVTVDEGPTDPNDIKAWNEAAAKREIEDAPRREALREAVRQATAEDQPAEPEVFDPDMGQEESDLAPMAGSGIVRPITDRL